MAHQLSRGDKQIDEVEYRDRLQYLTSYRSGHSVEDEGCPDFR